MKYNNKYLIINNILLLGLVTGGHNVLAAGTNKAETAELDTLTIQGQQETGYVPRYTGTATKTDTPIFETPQSISVITESRLEELDVDSLGESLRYTPGIQGEPFGFEPRFTFLRIRGFDATQTGLYRNGMQLRNPNFAGAYSLEPYGAERIEVLRGPASVLYGAGSPGGLVNFVTKRPTSERIREVGLEVGTYDRYQGKFDFAGKIDDYGAFTYRLTGLYRESDTHVDFVKDDRLFLAPALTWRLSSMTDVTFLGHFQQDDTNSSQAIPAAGAFRFNPNGSIPVSRYTGEPTVDKYERSDYSMGYEFNHMFNDSLRFKQKLSYYGNELNDITVYANSLAADQRTINRAIFNTFGDIDGLTLDNHIQLKANTGSIEHTLLLGVDYQKIDVSQITQFGQLGFPAGYPGVPTLDVFNPVYGVAVTMPPTFGDTELEQEQVGIYFQDQIRFLDKWLLTAGGRYDDASSKTINNLANTTTRQDDSEFTTRVGLTYVSDIGLAPYFSYTESFLPSAGTDVNGNPFEPETGQQYEVGIKFQPNGYNSYATVAVFELTRENYVETDPGTFLPVQTGEARSRGLELEGVANLENGLSFIASYTYVDVDIQESATVAEIGETPTQTPEHFASLWVDYAFPQSFLQGLNLGGGVRYIGSSYGNIPNTLKSPAETVFDAAARYAISDNLDLRLNVKNLLDEKQIASTYVRSGTEFATFGPERTVVGSLVYRF